MAPLPTVGNVQPVKGKATKSKKIKNRIYTQQDSLFLNLPAEIRNRIYEAFFASSTYRFIRRKTSRKDPKPLIVRKDRTKVKQHHLALLSACRQTYFEASAYPFQLGQFRFISLATFARLSDHFSPEQRMRITCLQLEVRKKGSSRPNAHVRRLFKQDPDIMLPSVRFMAWDIMLKMNQTVAPNRFVKGFKKDGRVEIIVRAYYLGSETMVWLLEGRI